MQAGELVTEPPAPLPTNCTIDEKTMYLFASEKYRNHKARIENIELLNSIGFEWGVLGAANAMPKITWDQWIAKLEEYIDENGNSSVPQMYKTTDGYCLGHFVANTRRAYKKYQNGNKSKFRGTLTASQITRLESIGFEWISPLKAKDMPQITWDEWITKLQHYIDEHGHAKVPRTWRTAEGFGLGETTQEETRPDSIGSKTAANTTIGFRNQRGGEI